MKVIWKWNDVDQHICLHRVITFVKIDELRLCIFQTTTEQSDTHEVVSKEDEILLQEIFRLRKISRRRQTHRICKKESIWICGIEGICGWMKKKDLNMWSWRDLGMSKKDLNMWNRSDLWMNKNKKTFEYVELLGFLNELKKN